MPQTIKVNNAPKVHIINKKIPIHSPIIQPVQPPQPPQPPAEIIHVLGKQRPQIKPIRPIVSIKPQLKGQSSQQPVPLPT